MSLGRDERAVEIEELWRSLMCCEVAESENKGLEKHAKGINHDSSESKKILNYSKPIGGLHGSREGL